MQAGQGLKVDAPAFSFPVTIAGRIKARRAADFDGPLQRSLLRLCRLWQMLVRLGRHIAMRIGLTLRGG